MKIPGIVRLLIVYVVLNVVLYLGQELYWMKDTQAMNKLDQELVQLETDLKSLESKATSGGLMEPYYSEYEGKVSSYNNKSQEYNTISKRSGSRWYLIPLPNLGGNKSKSNF